MRTIILAELHGWHIASGSERTVRLATKAYQDWTDPTPWWPLLEPTGGWTLAASAPGADGTDSATKVEPGELTLIELPPAQDRLGTPKLTELLDGLRVVGWPVELWAVGEGRPIGERVALGRLTVGEVERQPYGRVLRPRDRAADLDVPAVGAGVYGGGGGLDGVTALAGKSKEMLVGLCRHFEPTYLGIDPDNGCHLFSATQGLPMGGYQAVYLAGRPLTDEVTTTPTAGQWRQDATRGLLWVGGADIGLITCAAAGVTDADGVVIEAVGAVAAWLAIHSGALTDGEVDGAAAAGIGADRPAALWLPAGDTTTLRQALDDVTRSARADWYFGPDGRLTFALRGRPEAGAVPTATLRAGIDFVAVATEPRVTGIPARTVRIRYGQNGKVMTDADFVDLVTADDRAPLKTEWLEEVTPDDPDITAACPIPRVVTVDTRLSTLAAAAAEGLARRDEAFTVPGRYRLPMRRLPTEAVGTIVTVIDPTHPVFVGAGKVARVVEVKVDLTGEDNHLIVIPEGTD